MSTNDITTPSCPAAAALQAQPCAPGVQGKTWPSSQKALENDTPDAIADCASCRPQSQAWRGLAPTMAPSEADHGQTTALATP
ncbi:MAG: hypothetical protein J7598_22530 [Mitsuaria chitosanitabida]|uniref:hypothetical protein n=1 Tax=Roseateles chitosanitabidus TaxID=65048 RepID=UPI001B26F9F1|nr:hypothetical protein [Roseateles chitosanitabidus]MBO9689388.1 hypothetical protein [Roseateles chitosanitabidus]